VTIGVGEPARQAWHDRPIGFAVIAVIGCVLLLLPILVRHDFDLSVFIVAGDQFVDGLRTSAPIVVRPHSSGYDGQFYYALAIDPFHAGVAFHGVVIDHPLLRAQRIFYPLVVHAVALGRAAFVPAAMVAVNVAALFVLAYLARRRLPRVPALAVVLWPGLLTALTHDTTEVLTCAVLFGALIAYLDGRFVVFAVLGAMAALTREAASLLLGGIALAGFVSVVQERRGLKAWRDAGPMLAAGLALVPFVGWHVYLASAWRGTHEQIPVDANLGLPFEGLVTRVAETVAALFAVHGISVKARLMDVYVLGVVCLIVGFCGVAAVSAWRVWRRGGRAGAIALGWGCMMVLMTLLSAKGPWVEPTAAFRVFSECWLVGWLLTSLDQSRRLTWSIPALLPIAAVNYLVCIIQLRGGALPPH
jgi:hypothetical protein